VHTRSVLKFPMTMFAEKQCLHVNSELFSKEANFELIVMYYVVHLFSQL